MLTKDMCFTCLLQRFRKVMRLSKWVELLYILLLVDSAEEVHNPSVQLRIAFSVDGGASRRDRYVVILFRKARNNAKVFEGQGHDLKKVKVVVIVLLSLKLKCRQGLARWDYINERVGLNPPSLTGGIGR